MNSFVSFNHEIINSRNAELAAVSSAALYGRGVFTTVAVYRGNPFLINSHEKRLREHADKIRFQIDDVSFENVFDSLSELIAVNRIETGRARITLFDGGASRIWNFETNERTKILITAAARDETPPNNLKLTVSPFRVNTTSPLIAVKSCNYLENLLALESARANGFSEAIRLNERGEIVSAIMANLFWVRGKQISTPPLISGALAGTTREFVIESARQNGWEVVETAAALAELQTADEIFLTSAGVGVAGVKSFEENSLESRSTQKLQNLFAEIINQ